MLHIDTQRTPANDLDGQTEMKQQLMFNGFQ